MTTPTAEQRAAAERYDADDYRGHNTIIYTLTNQKSADMKILADFALAVMQGDGGELTDEKIAAEIKRLLSMSKDPSNVRNLNWEPDNFCNSCWSIGCSGWCNYESVWADD